MKKHTQDQTHQPTSTTFSDSKGSEYGKRLVIHVLDQYAQNEPDRPYAYLPLSSDPKDGWEVVTFKQLANAVNFVGHELVRGLADHGNQSEDFPTVAYIGPGDIRYVVFMLACIRARHKAFFPSPRNSLEGQISLLKATNCSTIYFAEGYSETILPWLERHPMRIVQAAAPQVWLESETVPLPYHRSYEDGRWDPQVVLHTSGSTGIPKPVVVRQGSFAVFDGLRNGPEFHGTLSSLVHLCMAEKIFAPVPQFHAAGVALAINAGIFYGSALVYGVPDRPLSADLATRSLVHSGADAAFLPPSILEEMSRTEAGISALASLDIVAFGGGNLAPAVGDMLVESGVVLSNLIAATECLPYTIHFQSNLKLWQYFIIHEKDMGAEFRPVEWNPEAYEMVLCNDDAKNPGRKAFFCNFPEKTEWRTGDLYEPHPTLPNHWKYIGRADNIIVFSNGEKLNPVTIEDAVQGHKAVKGAIVVGHQRFQPALIVEPIEPPADNVAAEALLQDVWSLVQEVNKATVAHGRISRDMIVLSDPAIPFSRAPKGTVQRNPTTKAYVNFIDELYQKVEEGSSSQDAVHLDLTSESTLAQSIIDVLTHQFGNPNVGLDSDLFSVGVDSLQVLRLSKLLRLSLGAAGIALDQNTIAPRVIYANPTPKALAARLFKISTGKDSQNNEPVDEVEALADMVLKYTADLPAPNLNQAQPADDAQTVLITGTTGSLGAYILDRLISSPRVGKVFALNRGNDGGQSRQLAFNAARGLSGDFSKVEFLGVDLSRQGWALAPAKYEELLVNADRIIHNAWPVNFVISVSSFEPHVQGVRRLVDFCNEAAKRVPIVFVSSVSTAACWAAEEPVPERQLRDLALAQMGYGRSKLAGSLVLDAAAERSGVPAASIRVGQIGGPRGELGMWNKQEYIPSLVASSIHLGMLPDTIGPSDVDWIPVDDIAGLVVDVGGISGQKAVSDISGYFHGVNPHKTTWNDVARVVKEFYRERIREIVPLENWVSALERSAEKDGAEDNPGIKLLDTYRGMVAANRAGNRPVAFDMRRTVQHSATMRNLGPITEELVRNWCKQWKF
ncbi:AMP-binding enzyme [Metarhizium robertsii]|uniref:NRPS-like enzyme n=2 Tax=Metarhizium robertsii TaxID=568076 RepID=E9ESW8_METRA|nr:NRPS-like enzyme [Metarhizium robertsii ARSEF 23]EFZ01783.1 NRPS-like enzyme [Metarhizium robertsii ARSEF 23]EXV02269.1 AMP-binding enzyme [Metarhizium robertsii]